MKLMVICIALICNFANAAPENTFDQIPLFREKRTFPALYQGSRFLKWDGDEVKHLSKTELRSLASERVNAICLAFGFKAGGESFDVNVSDLRYARTESWIPQNGSLVLITPSQSGSPSGRAWRAVTIVGALFIEEPVFFKALTCMK